MNTLRKLANDFGLPRILAIGGGAKISVMQVLVVPMLRTFLSKVVPTAPSQRAARGSGSLRQNAACSSRNEATRFLTHVKLAH